MVAPFHDPRLFLARRLAVIEKRRGVAPGWNPKAKVFGRLHRLSTIRPKE
jgi:hypothetical protein